MRSHILIPLVTVTILTTTSSPRLRGASSNAAEETEIRKAITAYEQGGGRSSMLSDSVFWSGAYKRPIVGAPTSASQTSKAHAEAAPMSQKMVTTPDRIIVADSRDLAYEYSSFTLDNDTKQGHVKLEGALLRVWQKQNGQWKIAAMFMRPYEK